MVASCCNARNLLLLTEERGVTGDGSCRILVRSLAAAMVRLVKDATGISNFVGYQVDVSAMHSADVDHAHTL